MTKGLLIYQVDAFADEPFSGNPAAVCILHQAMDDAWMQQVAQEMNLSETAFLVPDGSDFHLRWFTPLAEVDLCGHATLAAAHVLWEAGYLYPSEEARFHTRSGLLTAAHDEDRIVLDFPAVAVTPAAPPPGLLEALGVEAVAVGKNQYDYLVEVADAATVRALAPDFSALAKVHARGVMVTAQAEPAADGPADGPTDGAAYRRAEGEAYDFISRFFGPAVGVNEDPVTGSAHCALGPYWAAKLGKQTFLAYQASARGGAVHVELVGDRVRLGGRAVTVLRGEFV
ncbi:MAG: PhzF family phenazine biosynthesis protein [Litorilinea sp.]